MKKPRNRKKRPMFGPLVARFPHRRDMDMVAGAQLTAASISSPAMAVSPAPPPPEILAAPQTGDGLWAVCGGSSFGRIPLACSACVAGTSDGVALSAVSARPFCVLGGLMLRCQARRAFAQLYRAVERSPRRCRSRKYSMTLNTMMLPGNQAATVARIRAAAMSGWPDNSDTNPSRAVSAHIGRNISLRPVSVQNAVFGPSVSWA